VRYTRTTSVSKQGGVVDVLLSCCCLVMPRCCTLAHLYRAMPCFHPYHCVALLINVTTGGQQDTRLEPSQMLDELQQL